jgi:hypothetical protein
MLEIVAAKGAFENAFSRVFGFGLGFGGTAGFRGSSAPRL